MPVDTQQNLRAVAPRVRTQASAILTEEATEDTFVRPFISTVLGSYVFNLLKIAPEFVGDVGVRKSEKVRCAIKVHGEIVILLNHRGRRPRRSVALASDPR